MALDFDLTDLRWDPAVVLYRDPSGNRVSQSVLDEIVEGFKSQAGSLLADIATRLIEGSITLDEWELFVGEALYELWVRGYTVGSGGPDQYDDAHAQDLESGIRDQYEYLRRFSRDIESGILTDAQIRARLDLYVNGVRYFYLLGQELAFELAGFDEALRILEAGDSCDDCIRYAAMGWQPIGILPLPTQRCQCRTNCRCSIEYRSTLGGLGGLEGLAGAIRGR